MVGANTYDDAGLVPPFGTEVQTNLTAFQLDIEADFPNHYQPLIETYSPDNYGGSVMNAYSQYQGDKSFFCNQRQFADYVSLGLPSDSVYLYQYGALTSYDPVGLRGLFDEFNNTDSNWATHFAEVAMLFGTYQEISTQWWYTDAGSGSYVPPTEDERKLSQELMSRWASFAKTGRPNNENYRGWTPVPKAGTNSNGGEATDITQLFLSLEFGGFMSDSASLTDAIDRCSSFPNWIPFSVITDSPTYTPTECKSRHTYPFLWLLFSEHL